MTEAFTESQEVWPHRCDQCGDKFKMKATLDAHMRSHVEPDPVKPEPKAAPTTAKTNRLKNQARKLERKGEQFSGASKAMLHIVLGFLVAVVVAKSMQRQVGKLTDEEMEGLAIGEQLAKQMFDPILAKAEAIDPLVVVVNRVAAQQDLVMCALAWRSYFESVKKVRRDAESRRAIELANQEVFH